MEETEVLMAGFGGQGMLLAGKILAHAAMQSGLEVSWLPSYGPEMRGGTANVIVRLAPRPIASPLVSTPRNLIVMNLPSLEKFAAKVKPGGVIVVNTSLIPRDPERPDCVIVKLDSRTLAKEAGSERAANFAMLGGFVGAVEPVSPEAIEKAMEEEFQGPKARFVPGNVGAFRAGLAVGQAAKAKASTS